MSETRVEARKLQVGDRIKLADESVVKIRDIGKGFWPGAKLIDHDKGWSCVDGKQMVTVANG